MIEYGAHFIADDDLDAVIDVLRNGRLTQGDKVTQFETDLAQFVGAKHCVAVNSGTSALQMAYQLLDVGREDRVWTSPNTYVATSNAALQLGATIDFVDIQLSTFCLDPNKLEDKLRKAKLQNKLPKVVTFVAFNGMTQGISEIKQLSQKYGFKILEDACHGLGASYQSGDLLGSCCFSDITVFSFHPVKSITTGEGGALTFNQDNYKPRADRLRSGGVTRDRSLFKYPDDGPWYYEQLELGSNFRMPDILAALGSSQLKKLPRFIETRQELAQQYYQVFSSWRNEICPILIPQFLLKNLNWHFFPILFAMPIDPKTKTNIVKKLIDLGVRPNVHYIPVYWQPVYQSLGFKRGYLANSEYYYRQQLTLPLHCHLNEADVREIVNQLGEQLEDNLLPEIGYV